MGMQCNGEGSTDFVGCCGDVEWLTWNGKSKSIIPILFSARIPLAVAFFENIYFSWLAKTGEFSWRRLFQPEVKVGNDL